MADTTHTAPERRSYHRRIDKAWLLFAAVLAGLAVFAPAELFPSVLKTLQSLTQTGVFIAIAVLMIATLRATGAEAVVGRAFQGRESRMVILAALVGGLAPFCSCEVIPFVAALLAMGTPLSAVMAFWLSSPIMDPAMFVITSGALGLDFALGKTLAAVGFGLFGGFGVMALSGTALFNDPLRATSVKSCGCGPSDPFRGRTHWAFWQEADRRAIFRDTALQNALFLLKWLALAYLIEAVMVRFVPAEWIAATLGGEGLQPIALGALVGGPAYLNGYAAVPLVQGLLQQGMSQGAAMAFMMAGSVSCIPAAIAVWALVKPRVFAAYVAFGFTGSLMAGLAWAAWTAA